MGAESPSRTTAQPVWLSPEQVAERAPGLTTVALAELRKRRSGPAYYKPTLRTVLYLESEVDAWIEAARVATRSEVA